MFSSLKKPGCRNFTSGLIKRSMGKKAGRKWDVLHREHRAGDNQDDAYPRPKMSKTERK